MEPYSLFIDDLRDAPDSTWTVARTSSGAIAVIQDRGCPMTISFDHDLGGDDTAMTVVKRLIELDMDAGGSFIPHDFTFRVHSANPVGSENIRTLLAQYLAMRK